MGRLKNKLKINFKNVEESKLNIFLWHLLENQLKKKHTALEFSEKKKNTMKSIDTQL